MKARTLVTQRQYFGLDALNLRLAAARVLARVVGLSPERARVSVRNLQQDFAVSTVEGEALFDELVAQGLLVPRAAQQTTVSLNASWSSPRHACLSPACPPR